MGGEQNSLLMHVPLLVKREGFNFELVNFPFLDGDVSRFPSYGCISKQLTRFAKIYFLR